MPVHIFGQPADMGAIGAFAEKNALFVVEDACQAHGALYRGRPVGGWGGAAAFSFYPSKNLGGLGDGGMVVTNDDALAETVRLLRNCGRRGQYEHVTLGYNERLDNLQAAALLVKLKKLATWNRERRKIAALYQKGLAGSPARPLAVEPETEPVYHLFTVRAPRRDALQKFLAERGIASGVFYPAPLHLQKAFASLGYKKGDCPVAERACEEVLSLPCYPGLKPEDVRRVTAAVKDFFLGN
jgi:dTDP-4-amino-4,6-dideoxygalactose transaminase